VERSSYYEWLGREEKPEELKLVAEIRSVFAQSRKTYGAIRLTRELRERGYRINKKKVARIMKQEGLKSVHRKKFKVVTTDSNHNNPVANNLLEQDFTATAPNQKWASDITYIRTAQGWIYLAVVIDLYSRKIVGWSTSDSLETELCLKALKMALLRRGAPKELIHHSDRGVQYTSFLYRLLLKQNGITPSMSAPGNCYDNAVVESFFHTLKVECVYQFDFETRNEARREISDYIEGFYNCLRRHSALDYLNPSEYEKVMLAA
jgi:transposase InsO family protein